MVTEGTREQILAELDRYGSDRAQAGKTERAQEYARAIAILENGDDGDECMVEHMLYRIVEA